VPCDPRKNRRTIRAAVNIHTKSLRSKCAEESEDPGLQYTQESGHPNTQLARIQQEHPLKGPHGGGVEGEAVEEPGRVERAPVASWEGMRRSEKAKVSKEAVRRKGGGGGPMKRDRTEDG
jgi:hypothetical protein